MVVGRNEVRQYEGGADDPAVQAVWRS
jgi:hypothetical protein